MKPIKSTDEEALNAAFAERVAGWTKNSDGLWLDRGDCQIDLDGNVLIPKFTRSADAVLPWLEKWEFVNVSRYPKLVFSGWFVQVAMAKELIYRGSAPTLPHAAVIALLRAHGVEVED